MSREASFADDAKLKGFHRSSGGWLELLLDYSCLVEFEPDESFLLTFFVERNSLGTSRIDDWGSVDHFSLIIVEVA